MSACRVCRRLELKGRHMQTEALIQHSTPAPKITLIRCFFCKNISKHKIPVKAKFLFLFDFLGRKVKSCRSTGFQANSLRGRETPASRAVDTSRTSAGRLLWWFAYLCPDLWLGFWVTPAFTRYHYSIHRGFQHFQCLFVMCKWDPLKIMGD